MTLNILFWTPLSDMQPQVKCSFIVLIVPLFAFTPPNLLPLTAPFPFMYWQIDYFVDCHYSGADDRLWVIGGTSSGTLGYFPINHQVPSGGIGPAEAILEGGHSGVVRTVLPVSCTRGNLSRNNGIFGWTGGEDGRLCCWLSDKSLEANRSWASSALVMKSQKIHKLNRRNPY